MTLRTLLLATAATFVAISGARAADAVVMVEPEPVEYVRICDVYGAGFFYIPGTETCLKVGGYVRARFVANDQEDQTSNLDGNEDYRFGTQIRARLDFDAREETELGTLRSKIRLEATNLGGSDEGYGTSDNDVNIEEAYIQLGGLTIGKVDSLWTNDDGGIEDGLLMEESDWAAGDITSNRISYTYAANGFSGSLSVEDDGDGDVTPDVLGKLAYVGGFGGAYLLGVYDEDSGAVFNSRFGTGPNQSFGNYVFGAEDLGGNGKDDGAFVVKGGVLLENLVAEGSIFKVEGHYAFDPSVYAVVGNVGGWNTAGSNNFDNQNGDGLAIPSEYQIGAAYSQEFGKLFAAVSGVYGQTFDLSTAFTDLDGIGLDNSFVDNNIGSVDYYGVAGNVGYDITTNFKVLGEVSYVDLDLPAGIDDYDQTRGFVQFQRDF